MENVTAFNEQKYYGKSLYLLGNAEYGPTNQVVKANSMNHVARVFGEQGSLVDAYRYIREANIDCNVYLVKTTGIYSEAYLNVNQLGGSIIQNGLYLKSRYSNEIFNLIEIDIEEEYLGIYYPIEFGDYYIQYFYDDYPTLVELQFAINNDADYGIGYVECCVYCDELIPTKTALYGVNANSVRLSGGNSGLYYNKNMIYNCLEETYSILEGRPIDIILPLDVYFDDVYTDDEMTYNDYYSDDREYLTLKKDNKYLNYYNQLLKFCVKQLNSGLITNGILGLQLTNDMFVDEDYYLDKLQYFKKINVVDKEVEDLKFLVSVCSCDLYARYGTAIINSSIVYSALCASLSVNTNTTNISIPKYFSLFNTFENEMLQNLSEAGFVSFRFSPLTKEVTVVNGVTTSSHYAYKYFCNVRMVQISMCYINDLLKYFIGDNINDLIESGYLEDCLTTTLDNLVSASVLTGYMINEIANPELGQLYLDLDFKTLYMVEYVKAYTGAYSIIGEKYV